MAEVLIQFDAPIVGADGQAYVARVCGREAKDRLWEGWIEFHPQVGGSVLRTPRETKQPDRADLEYWATGLTATYLEGALERALHPRTNDLRGRQVAARPRYDQPADRPAPASTDADRSAASHRIYLHAVLDPFMVYAQGEDVLREELSALDVAHLRNVVRAYGLVGEEELDLQALHRSTLGELIIAAVRRRAG